jgi:hypothetical protein
MTRALRLLTAAALLGAVPLAAPVTTHAAATPSPRPAPTVLATGTTPDGKVAIVVGSRDGAGTTEVPGRPPTAAVATDGGQQPAEVRPVWSDDAAIGLVVDVSDATGPAFQAGLSGAAGLLLQLPAESRSGVVADRAPPVLVAGPEPGVTDDVQALSELTAGGARGTSAALTLALDRLPARRGDRSVLVLYTSARDAGGEPATALGERLRAAGAVLAVVTTAPAAGYWTQVAQVTGGLAVVAPADRPIGAFDQVADTLRARYVATFARPATGGAELRWTTDGTTSALPLTIPAAPAPGSAGAGSRATGDGSSPAPPLVPGLVAVLLLALVAAVVLVRRRRDRVLLFPESLRVFDMTTDDAPKEITGSLSVKQRGGDHRAVPRWLRTSSAGLRKSEEREAEAPEAEERAAAAEEQRQAEEDEAREAEARAVAAEEQRQAEEDEAREWAGRRLAELQQRRSDEAAAAAEGEDSGA